MLDFLGELSLTLDKRVHPVGVFEHLRVAESIVDFFIFPEKVHHFLHTLLNDLDDRFVRIHLGFLLKIAYGIAWCPHHFALVGFLHTGNNLQKGGFSGTVEAYDSDFRSVEEG